MSAGVRERHPERRELLGIRHHLDLDHRVVLDREGERRARTAARRPCGAGYSVDEDRPGGVGAAVENRCDAAPATATSRNWRR
ncbi:hypothetical protein [Rhodococcus indonesiensis]